MKKILTVLMLFAAVIVANAQTDAADNVKFLNRYSALIKRMKPEHSENIDSLYAWSAERKKIKVLYTERYRRLLTDDQLEEYSAMTAQYKSKSAEFKLDKFSEKMDTLGTKVSKSLQRTGRKVSGLIKGLKAQSDANRNK